MAAHLDSSARSDLGDGGSVNSEAFSDLLHGHPGHVSPDGLLTLRVAQMSLRHEYFRLRQSRANCFDRVALGEQ